MCNFGGLVAEDGAVGLQIKLHLHIVSHGICCCHGLLSSPSSRSWSTILFASELGFGSGMSEIMLASIHCGEGKWVNGISCVAFSRHVAAIKTLHLSPHYILVLQGSSTCCHSNSFQAMIKQPKHCVFELVWLMWTGGSQRLLWFGMVNWTDDK